jgi:hypothetical protein
MSITAKRRGGFSVQLGGHPAVSTSTLPLRILFIFTNPIDNERLRIDAEVNKIHKRIQRSLHSDSIRFFIRFALEPGDIPQFILEIEPHVVHFSGHGTKSAEILITDVTGTERAIGEDALIELFGILKSRIPVCLVVLNACSTKLQAKALAAHVRCAIGMNDALKDDAAITFSAAFYGAIGFGCSVREAFELGRNELRLLGLKDSDVPELFPRDEPEMTDVSLITRAAPDARTRILRLCRLLAAMTRLHLSFP